METSHNHVKTFLKGYLNEILFFIILFETISISQYYYDVIRGGVQIPVPPTIIPAEAIKLADLGLHSAAASALWIYTIQQASGNPDKLPELIENVNATDPKFSYPYAFAALTLPDIGINPERAIKIAEDGIEDADSDWRIPYYLATTYHIYLRNREKAAYYFDLAARTPGASNAIKSIAYFYGTTTNIREQTKQIWISIRDSSKDELVIKRAGEYVAQIEILDALDRAVLLYRQRYGKYPEKTEDLVTGKIIKKIPDSPLGSRFLIKDGKVIVR